MFVVVSYLLAGGGGGSGEEINATTKGQQECSLGDGTSLDECTHGYTNPHMIRLHIMKYMQIQTGANIIEDIQRK